MTWRMKTLALLALMLPGPLFASPPETVVTLEVLPGWDTDSGTHMAGLRLTMAPGWKTYWRAPGEAGLPPLFDWSGSENLAGLRVHWPVPEIFDQEGMRSIGYYDSVVLPLEIAPDGAGPIRLAGSIDLGVCKDVCVPARLEFVADLSRPGRRNGAIVAALIDRPLQAGEAGLSAVACRIVPTPEGFAVNATLDLPRVGQPENVVIETADPEAWVSEPETRREGETLHAEAEIRGGSAIDRSGLRITVLGSGRAVEVQGCPAG